MWCLTDDLTKWWIRMSHSTHPNDVLIRVPWITANMFVPNVLATNMFATVVA